MGPPSSTLKRKSSVFLSTHDDPFALREGKTLMWTNVDMVLNNGKDSSERKLLDKVWGEVPKQETTAIMGPSGAGKTSLLNILAGRVASRGKVKVSADVRLDDYRVDPTNIRIRKQIAFVAQDDSLQVTSTPREAIYFSAKLRLPRSTPERLLIKLTNKMLNELGLSHCADTIVGGALIKGISGGERKRTSVGVELVVKPALVFLDEPTSGLDSFSAVQLCQVLKKVANAGASVLFTIHQPASEIFRSFDHLILLNKGRVMYQGEVDDVADYFEQRNQPIPPMYNPADWIMHIAQSVPLEELEKNHFFPKDTRKLAEPTESINSASAFFGRDVFGSFSEYNISVVLNNNTESSPANNPHEDNQNENDKRPPGLLIQTKLLYNREFKNLRRDISAVGARFGMTMVMSFLTGTIFHNVGETDNNYAPNLQSHFGALIMALLQSMFGTAQPALLAFPSERPVFLREYSTNHYSVISYFVSRLTIEAMLTAGQCLIQSTIVYFMIGLQMNFLTFVLGVYVLAMSSTALAVMLGCAIEDPKLAQEMLPLLFVPQMLFAGFFVIPPLIPSWLRWIRFICSLTYAVRIMLVAEFDIPDCEGCQNLLQTIEADPDEVWWNWIVLIGVFVIFRIAALMLLKKKATKFF